MEAYINRDVTKHVLQSLDYTHGRQGACHFVK